MDRNKKEIRQMYVKMKTDSDKWIIIREVLIDTVENMPDASEFCQVTLDGGRQLVVMHSLEEIEAMLNQD